MIAGVLGTETPQYGAAVAIEIHRLIALCIVTTTTRTDRLTATIVV